MWINFHHFFCSPADESVMTMDGAILLLSVFDHDVVGTNDFAGMCVVACKDIPRLVSAEASLIDAEAPQPKNLTLPLFHYSQQTSAFAELDVRARLGDNQANDFFKLERTQHILGNLANLRRRGSLLDSIILSGK